MELLVLYKVDIYLFNLEWHKTTITSQKSKSVRLISHLSVTSVLAFLTNLAISQN